MIEPVLAASRHETNRNARGLRDRQAFERLQRFALPSDSAEAVQPNQLYGHYPCLSPERAIFFSSVCRGTARSLRSVME
jgi:hypothetical protein